MGDTTKSNIGYTFWLVSNLCNSTEFNLLVEKMHKEQYRIDEYDTFIITDETSRGAIDESDVIEIPSSMIRDEDSAIYSIVNSMKTRRVLLITSDDKSEVSSLAMKKALAVIITHQFGDTRCTIISEPLSVVNTMDDTQWEKYIGSSNQGVEKRLSNESLSVLRGIQFSRGESIITLYRLTSYLLSCLNWEDSSLVAVGIAHINEVTHSQLEDILSQKSPCKGEYTWNMHGYIHLRIDRLEGYNFTTPRLSSILSSLGKRSFKLYSLLLKNSQ